jgi:hypothetical protein
VLDQDRDHLVVERHALRLRLGRDPLVRPALRCRGLRRVGVLGLGLRSRHDRRRFRRLDRDCHLGRGRFDASPERPVAQRNAAGAQRCFEGGHARDQGVETVGEAAGGLRGRHARPSRIDALLDPVAHEVAGSRVGLGGELLQRPKPARVEPDGHRALVGGSVVAWARLVGPTATAPATAAGRRSPVTLLPVLAAALAAWRPVVAVALRSVGSAIGAAASVETHRLKRYAR